jgi:hypothetical protein
VNTAEFAPEFPVAASPAMFFLKEVFHLFQEDARFQTVFVLSLRHFSHILPTWFLVFITTKDQMSDVRSGLIP